MSNPFKEGDKVSTKVKGQPIEAVVTKTWKNEVQVRAADKKLLWRTIKTISLLDAPPVPVTAGPAQPGTPNGVAITKANSAPEPTKSVPYKRKRSGRDKFRKI